MAASVARPHRDTSSATTSGARNHAAGSRPAWVFALGRRLGSDQRGRRSRWFRINVSALYGPGITRPTSLAPIDSCRAPIDAATSRAAAATSGGFFFAFAFLELGPDPFLLERGQVVDKNLARQVIHFVLNANGEHALTIDLV